MNSENEYKVISYQGILITNDGTPWYLLMNRPIDREMWMNDNERMFLGCQPRQRPEIIAVSGYTLRLEATGMIEIEKDNEEDMVDLTIE